MGSRAKQEILCSEDSGGDQVNRTNGVTMQEAADALTKMVRRLPPVGEEEIKMIKSNPSLSIIQKWLLIRKIKRG